MAKPWARIEVGYLNHPKFLALTATAICLWHEGKNYCDMHHTDGLIPRDALKTFRFRGTATIAVLMKSCGAKPNGTPYAPLWEPHDLGYKMHDYLDHNDCREQVLERLQDADEVAQLRKLANRDRQRKARADRRARLEQLTRSGQPVTAPVTPVTRDITRDSTRDTYGPTETEAVSETRTPPDGGVARPRLAPIHTTHKKHAHCGRVCLHASLFDEFVRRRNHAGADAEIRDWALAIDREWQEGGPHGADEPGDPFEFWKTRYAERWPATPVSAGPSDPGPDTAKARYGGMRFGE